MDNCRLATSYAVRISRCKTIAELDEIGVKIKADLPRLTGWEEWLRDWWTSRRDTIKEEEK